MQPSKPHIHLFTEELLTRIGVEVLRSPKCSACGLVTNAAWADGYKQRGTDERAEEGVVLRAWE